ncbi:hypothetical protein [Paraburkholderia sp. DHOC27]|uniref:hypothetical protein n=1 Tax=Paraburkholderia sp. DHOC27 TaxID=2303330 RepID=UPI000E3CEF41|nr:hypothetical protein [Paraburkholderia sp. DHOC27]RFU48647.1 hypothetical protein D0B32_02070 [Paraburkholderia sp. DHOC27]
MAVTKKQTPDAAPDTSEEFDEQPVQSIASEPVTVGSIKAAALAGNAVTHIGHAMTVTAQHIPGGTGKGIALAGGWVVDDLNGQPYRVGNNQGTFHFFVNGTPVTEATLVRMLERS